MPKCIFTSLNFEYEWKKSIILIYINQRCNKIYVLRFCLCNIDVGWVNYIIVQEGKIWIEKIAFKPNGNKIIIIGFQFS